MLSVQQAREKAERICTEKVSEYVGEDGFRKCIKAIIDEISGEVSCSVGIVKPGIKREDDIYGYDDIDIYIICRVIRSTGEVYILRTTAEKYSE